MTEQQKSLLEVQLKSQLQIENAVLEGLDPIGSGVINDALRKVSHAKVKEIRRQIGVLSMPVVHSVGLKIEREED